MKLASIGQGPTTIQRLGSGVCASLGMVGPFQGPCTQIVYTLAPKYLYKGYFKAKVYTIWVPGPLEGGF